MFDEPLSFDLVYQFHPPAWANDKDHETGARFLNRALAGIKDPDVTVKGLVPPWRSLTKSVRDFEIRCTDREAEARRRGALADAMKDASLGYGVSKFVKHWMQVAGEASLRSPSPASRPFDSNPVAANKFLGSPVEP